MLQQCFFLFIAAISKGVPIFFGAVKVLNSHIHKKKLVYSPVKNEKKTRSNSFSSPNFSSHLLS